MEFKAEPGAQARKVFRKTYWAFRKKIVEGSWNDGSVVKGEYCSSRRSKSSQSTHTEQLKTAYNSGAPDTFLLTPWVPALMCIFPHTELCIHII